MSIAGVYYNDGFKKIRFRSVKKFSEYFDVHPLLAAWWLYAWADIERDSGRTPYIEPYMVRGTGGDWGTPPYAQLYFPEEFVSELVNDSEGKLAREMFCEDGVVSGKLVEDYIYGTYLHDRYYPNWIGYCSTMRYKKEWGVIYIEWTAAR